MYQALYRKYRPVRFDDVYGQEHITDVLKQEIKTDSIHHAYLFSGSRGTGKTTCAKILAKAANCEQPKEGNPCGECAACKSIEAGQMTDVIEMDAASNNGVDYIREIKEDVVYSPAALTYRVYILDEVHMLSEQAFNALLKTLEEPPKGVIFILATTEIHKIPATVLSRCLRFEFRRIPTDIIAKRLLYIADKEGISLEHDAAFLMASLAKGGMRDAISTLEMCSAHQGSITAQTVRGVMGVSDRSDLEKMMQAVYEEDCVAIFDMLQTLYQASKDMEIFVEELLSYNRDLLLIKACGDKLSADLFDLSTDELEKAVQIAELFDEERLLYFIHVLEEAYMQVGRAKTAKRLFVETALMQMLRPALHTAPSALLARIAALEKGAPPRAVYTTSEEKAPVIEKSKLKTEQKESNKQAPSVGTESGGEKAAAYWRDVVEKYGQTDMGTATFLGRARAYRQSGGILCVAVTDSFSEMILKKDDIMNKICSLAREYDAEVTSVQIEVRKKTADAGQANGQGIDLFISDNEEG
ncbi:MAG: DNA polymerase III subunit gamma/tau [Clostridiales bacterium]|nr:DNA polymerase III subunit gamma/tau [Clostridiales bacterium]